MEEILKLAGSIGAGGVIVIFSLKYLFSYLEKNSNNKVKNYLSKEEHTKECDYKLGFIKADIYRLENKIDKIYDLLIKLNGGK